MSTWTRGVYSVCIHWPDLPNSQGTILGPPKPNFMTDQELDRMIAIA